MIFFCAKRYNFYNVIQVFYLCLRQKKQHKMLPVRSCKQEKCLYVVAKCYDFLTVFLEALHTMMANKFETNLTNKI